MSTRRKRPTLRFDGKYWITTIYKPNGVRGTVSFGSTEARSEKDIKIAFERWIELYLKQPRKTLSFSSPYGEVWEGGVGTFSIGEVQTDYDLH